MSDQNDLLSIDIINSDVFLRLPIIPKAIRDEVGDKIAEYLLEELRNPPPYRYVSRKAAYGVTFFTDRQRRWFFANLDDLDIPYKRTGTLTDGWKITEQGIESVLINETPYAGLVYGDRQSRHLAMIGWQKIPAFLRERKTGIRHIIIKTVGSVVRRVMGGLLK